MANAFKPLDPKDVTLTRTLLHEAIPLTGTIVSGTYNEAVTADSNIKNYSHGMFQSVYDYPYLSSSANHTFDLTFGYSANSTLSGNIASVTRVQQEKKINIYNQMAQVLMGFDSTGSVKEFRIPGGSLIREAYFMSFTRLLTKDEVSKNNFSIVLDDTGGGRAWSGQGTTMKYQTLQIPTSNNEPVFYTDSPAGEYSVLSASATSNQGSGSVGLIFYQAGIVVLGTASIGNLTGSQGATGVDALGATTLLQLATGSSISASCNGLRHNIADISFNNTTELNSTIYFCRANHNEFNYSSNPTYLTASKIMVKEDKGDQPISYITTVGLYSPDNELLATAKLSEPLKKDPSSEYTLRVRLDY
jgi:hypothetical protein